jgi:polar amino acid transport system substrate-binding protein
MLLATPAGASTPGEATATPPSLTVAISAFEPFVILDGESPSGFSIDLWREVAAHAGRSFSLRRTSGVEEKLALLEKGEVDVAVGGITVTSEREARVDFTHASLRAGTGVLVRLDDEASLWERLGLTRVNWGVAFAFLLLIVVAGHLIWLAERGKDSFSDRYLAGVGEGMYWAIVTASTVGYGDKTPDTPSGRLVASLVIVISLPMFALFTADLASALTAEELGSHVQGLDDLNGRPVAVVAGTTGSVWASEHGLTVVPYASASEADQALLSGQVEAVVHDRPHLAYFAAHEGAGKVRVLDDVYRRQEVAFAVAEQRPLREELNRALLELTERGDVRRLQVKWFGG